MKKFPTALTVPRSSLRVWLTIAPPLEARAPALGRLCVGAAAGVAATPGVAGAVDAADVVAGLPRPKKLVSIPLFARNAFSPTSCHFLISLHAVACLGIVAPPIKTTPRNNLVRTMQAILM